MQIELPSSFLWGAAISSYQTEGKNFNTDWCLWEKERKLEEAGIACNHYYLFKKDFELARQLNLNCLRFSLEWARVCPEPGVYLDQELEHYKEVVATLLKFNLKPIATLHHFTNPIWFVKKGGWLSSENIDFFLEYLKRTVEALKDKIEYWLIINEPLVYIYNSFVLGIWPPGVKSLNDALRVLKNIISAYIVGYEEIKMIYSDTPVQISLAKHLRTFSACPKYNFGLNSLSAYLRDRAFNLYLLDYLKKKDRLDFIAINYYCKENVRFKGLMGEECKHDFSNERKNLLGWYFYPQGLYDLLVRLKRFSLPVIITENGTAEKEDFLYEDYLVSHLKSMTQAISCGVDIRGYLWWSLIDNFEWDKGFNYRFGLIEVDYKTLSRRIKPFAFTYARICKENRLTIDEH